MQVRRVMEDGHRTFWVSMGEGLTITDAIRQYVKDYWSREPRVILESRYEGRPGVVYDSRVTRKVIWNVVQHRYDDKEERNEDSDAVDE